MSIKCLKAGVCLQGECSGVVPVGRWWLHTRVSIIREHVTWQTPLYLSYHVTTEEDLWKHKDPGRTSEVFLSTLAPSQSILLLW